jgi:hypothetical protein
MSEFFETEESSHLFQLIFMLQRSAMMHMGMLPDSEGRAHFNLGETRVAIDTLRMLQNRTKGNLDEKEGAMLSGVISELQLQFVKAPARQKELDEAAARQETIRETFSNPREGPSEVISDDEE